MNVNNRLDPQRQTPRQAQLPTQLELGLDTFGDVTHGADGVTTDA